MSSNTINYQRIYEEELNQTTLDSLELPRGFYELSSHHRLLFEQLVDIGYQQALTDALDPGVLDDTADLSLEMANQLSSFSDMLRAYVVQQQGDE
jgi:hypothetical protein